MTTARAPQMLLAQVILFAPQILRALVSAVTDTNTLHMLAAPQMLVAPQKLRSLRILTHYTC